MTERKLIGGNYEIHELVGQGGMATVYAGVDTRTDQPVAIKLLKPEIIESDPEIVTRFEREGQALARLNHPNIVKVLATVREDEQNYVIMELVTGGDLRTMIDDCRQREEMISVRRVMDIALDLSDALARAHRLNIIHRDLKPGNVLMAEDGTPRLTDFGVARFSDSTRMTQTGTLVGTLAYLSPETCAGYEATESADIWAFGVMLYEMLTLQRPFNADNSAAMLNAILNQEPEPLTNLRPDIPPDLVALVESMMRKKSEERISSVRLVGAQLEAMLAGRELPTSTPTSDSRPTALDGPTVALDSSQTAGMMAAAQPKRGLSPLMISGVLVAIIAVIAAVVLLMGGGDDAGETVDTGTVGSQQSGITQVQPVAAGTHMVLVAALESLGSQERDVSRFIADDLTRRFEEDVPFSTVRIRQTPDVVTSPEQALEVAEANNATIIIWGDYDDDEINLRMDLGSLVDFPDQPFSREDLEVLANVRIRMEDERRQSLTASIVAIMNLLATADRSQYDVGLNLAILQIADPNSPEIVGQSAAANWHRNLVFFFEDTDRALQAIEDAIAINPHPILYMARTLAHTRLGDFEQIPVDYRTASQLGPEGWGMAEMGLGSHEWVINNNIDEALRNFESVHATGLNNWWVDTSLGTLYLIKGRNDEARPFLESSMEAEPPINWPHIMALSLAMREGRVVDAATLSQEAARYNVDPNFEKRIVEAAYGERNYDNSILVALNSFGNVLIGQWLDVIDDAESILESGTPYPDIYLLQGLAHCNLEDYEAAETSYTNLLEELPDYYVAYLLRAEVRQKLGNNVGALADVAVAMNSEQAENFQPLLPILQSGEVNCTNMFEVDLEALMAESDS